MEREEVEAHYNAKKDQGQHRAIVSHWSIKRFIIWLFRDGGEKFEVGGGLNNSIFKVVFTESRGVCGYAPPENFEI